MKFFHRHLYSIQNLNSLNGFIIKTKWTREFCLSNIVGHLSWLKTQMALMHWDYIDRLGKAIPSGLPFKKISMMTTSTLLA
jgi:hypothetical protein